LGKKEKEGIDITYKYNASLFNSLKEFFSSFPILYFGLEDELFKWYPSDYLVVNKNDHTKYYLGFNSG
jgi:hypothetical protein